VSEPTRTILTTTPGLEDVVVAELTERAARAGLSEQALAWPDVGVAGRVRVDAHAPEETIRRIALSLRSIHHALRHVEAAPLADEDPLAHLADRIRRQHWPELDPQTPFRVTADRHGRHPFSSYDLQVVAGTALQSATRAPVDLRGYACDVCVDVVYERYLIGVRWSRQPLGLRFDRPFNQRVALKPPVAYAMLRLASGSQAPARLLDPFCGTGTILLEGGSIFPEAGLYGGDLRSESVDGARQNLHADGLVARAHLRAGDARAIGDALPPAAFDLIATNPPYGRRMGRGIHFVAFYSAFLEAAWPLLRPGGRLGVLVGKRGAFNKAFRQMGGWQLHHVRVIDMNHVRAGLFVLERP
jgi:putative N6-adenine-specific DNA methylase/tRNA (guanine6-N2)-methyltransferase